MRLQRIADPQAKGIRDTPYFAAAHLERFGIANIARMQDV
jgi:hypothetical protein